MNSFEFRVTQDIELDNIHQGYRRIIYGHGVADRSSHRFSESLHNYTYSRDFETVEESIKWLEEKNTKYLMLYSKRG